MSAVRHHTMIEFFGGPCDGHRRTVRCTIDEVKPTAIIPLPFSTDAAGSIHCGRFALKARRCMRWIEARANADIDIWGLCAAGQAAAGYGKACSADFGTPSSAAGAFRNDRVRWHNIARRSVGSAGKCDEQAGSENLPFPLRNPIREGGA